MSVIEREHVESPPVTTRDVLHRAADLLEEFGWCQNRLSLNSEEGQVIAYCAGGACMRAMDDLGLGEADRFDWNEALMPFSKALGLDRHMQFWNDEPGRTKAEVVERLRSV